MFDIMVIVAAMIGIAIVAILIFAATKPDTFRIQRSTAVKAPPEKIFALISNLRGWGAWSPYEKKDPAMKRSYSGPDSGKGATYAWEGDKNVGRGRMEIIDVSLPSKVTIKLDFFSPFEAHNIAEFTMVPNGDTTTVTWAMHGPSPYMAKLMTTFFNMDKMCGNDFEVGLASLKALAEKQALTRQDEANDGISSRFSATRARA